MLARPLYYYLAFNKHKRQNYLQPAQLGFYNIALDPRVPLISTIPIYMYIYAPPLKFPNFPLTRVIHKQKCLISYSLICSVLYKVRKKQNS